MWLHSLSFALTQEPPIISILFHTALVLSTCTSQFLYYTEFSNLSAVSASQNYCGFFFLVLPALYAVLDVNLPVIFMMPGKTGSARQDSCCVDVWNEPHLWHAGNDSKWGRGSGTAAPVLLLYQALSVMQSGC